MKARVRGARWSKNTHKKTKQSDKKKKIALVLLRITEN